MTAPDRGHASSRIDATSTCLADSASGKDRKLFVRWLSIAISKHPEISALSAVDANTELASNQAAGALMTRLLADDCGEPIKLMVKVHGVASIAKAFEVFGRMAMMELMADPNVGAAFSGIDKYTDRERIEAALRDQ